MISPCQTRTYTARPSAGIKIASRQARQDRKEGLGKDVVHLAISAFFARDINLYVLRTCSITHTIWKCLSVAASLKHRFDSVIPAGPALDPRSSRGQALIGGRESRSLHHEEPKSTKGLNCQRQLLLRHRTGRIFLPARLTCPTGHAMILAVAKGESDVGNAHADLLRCRDKGASSVQQIDGPRDMVGGRLAAMVACADRKPKLRSLCGAI